MRSAPEKCNWHEISSQPLRNSVSGQCFCPSRTAQTQPPYNPPPAKARGHPRAAGRVSPTSAEINSYCHFSSKNPAAATFPGYRPLAGVVTSITAQSGSFAICRALFRLSNSRNVKPLFRTTYFFPFNGLG